MTDNPSPLQPVMDLMAKLNLDLAEANVRMAGLVQLVDALEPPLDAAPTRSAEDVEAALLWPDVLDPEPQHSEPLWVWTQMTASERAERLAQLDHWVRWFVSAHSLQHMVPHCWALHPSIRQHLTVLYQSWTEVRRDANEGTHYMALRWQTDLEVIRHRLTNQCAVTGDHQPEHDRTKWSTTTADLLHSGRYQDWPDLEDNADPTDSEP